MSWVLPHPKPHRLMVSRVIVKQGKNNTMPGTLLYLVCIAVALTPADAFAAHPSCASLRHSTVDDVVRSSFSQYRQRRDCWTTAISMSSKGFGPPPPPKPTPPPKSKKGIEREQASKAYDEMAAAGIPEYNIFIKPKGTEDYLPAGVMAVPRSQQVSQAIFEQEENLKAAAFKFYDKLKNYDEFEYGYTLKMFPDDPVTPIEKRAPSTNPVTRFFEGLLSPVNTAGMKGPPVEPPPS